VALLPNIWVLDGIQITGLLLLVILVIEVNINYLHFNIFQRKKGRMSRISSRDLKQHRGL